MPDQIIKSVQQAIAEKTPLHISGGHSKDFYGRQITGDELSVADYSGIVAYEPTELVITARCGTPISEITTVLAEQNQTLPFEPPSFANTATVGGTVACGLSGVARPYTGSVRDFVLGVRMINGKAEDLTFGGQVMKNVAGFDVSRLMAGSLGTLGVILEASFKLAPKPEAEFTIQLEMDQQKAIILMNQLAGQAIPLSAACYFDGRLSLRLAGYETALRSAREKIGGECLENAQDFWHSINEQEHAFFESSTTPLWRVAVPPATDPIDLESECLVDWGGAQRWYRSDLSAERIRAIVLAKQGHATLFRKGNSQENQLEIFSPLSPAIKNIHQRLKQSFDPAGIFNMGKMYADL